MIEIGPSILAADFARLGEEVEAAARGGAGAVHVDVMDGHFVPNLTIGLPVVRSLARVTSLPLDCHLMIEEPERWAARYAEAGAAIVTVHVEAARHVHRALAAIRECGARAGVAINPGTPLAALEELVDHVDRILVMSVDPGFSGQKFIPESVAKVARLARLLRERGASPVIQVDGGVGPDNVAELVRAGARAFVAGSAVFGGGDPAAAVAELRRRAEAAL
ncbi:MAG: ribulose-phosphate 3-epimerase [Acidobacteria bacterium]|nr:MAG: ribulose-phosphate 3-epimerase [Acidobacteriota bacterium]